MDEQRFVVVASDAAEIDSVVHEPDVLVLERLDIAVLIRTTPERSRELSVRPGVVASVYASESLGRLAIRPFKR